MMNLLAENGLLNAVAAYLHHATPGLGPDLETYQCADWGNKQKEVAAQTMAYLDEVLADNDYLAGAEFSAADITAYAGLVFADFAEVDIPETLSHLTAWRAKVAARPSIAG
jgi:glutathione S-transferase